MPRKSLYFAILPFAAATAAGAAVAYDPIVETRGWAQLDYDRDGGCTAEIRGNGKVFLINVAGLGVGGQGRYRLTNEDIKPIEWTITANREGQWYRYYLPFIADREAGTVRVSIAAPRCSLDLAFDWDTYNPAYNFSTKRALIESEGAQ